MDSEPRTNRYPSPLDIAPQRRLWDGRQIAWSPSRPSQCSARRTDREAGRVATLGNDALPEDPDEPHIEALVPAAQSEKLPSAGPVSANGGMMTSSRRSSKDLFLRSAAALTLAFGEHPAQGARGPGGHSSSPWVDGNVLAIDKKSEELTEGDGTGWMPLAITSRGGRP